MTLLQFIGLALLFTGVFSLMLELAHLKGDAKVAAYATHMVIGRVFYTVGVIISIFSTNLTGTLLIVYVVIMVLATIFVWFWGFKSLENYKELKKSRQDLDELLDNWRK